MGGATFVMLVIRGVFSPWADTIYWSVRCDWLQVASVVTYSLQVNNFYLASLIIVVIGVIADQFCIAERCREGFRLGSDSRF